MRTAVGVGIVVVAALLACKQNKSSAGTETTAAPAATPAAQGDPRFQLRFGIPKSPTDAEIETFPERFSTGYVGYKLTTQMDQFPVKKIRNTLYALDGGERQQLTRSESDLSGDINVFYKSWKLPETGTYEVLIEDATTNAVIATGRFRVEE